MIGDCARCALPRELVQFEHLDSGQWLVCAPCAEALRAYCETGRAVQSEASRTHVERVGKRQLSPEHRARIGAALLGRRHSPVTRAKISAAHRGR